MITVIMEIGGDYEKAYSHRISIGTHDCGRKYFCGRRFCLDREIRRKGHRYFCIGHER